MASIYQIIPKEHRNKNRDLYQKYLGVNYRTYFQYSQKRFDGKRKTLQKYIGQFPYIKPQSAEYDKKLKDWEVQLEKNIFSKPKFVIDEMVEEFMKFRKTETEHGNYSTKSYSQYKGRLKYFSEWLIKKSGRIELNNLTPTHIFDFTEHLTYEKPKLIRRGRTSELGSKGLSNKTVIGYLSSVKVFLTWANRKDYISNEVITDINLKWEWPDGKVRVTDKERLFPQVNHYEKYVKHLQKKVKTIPYQTHLAGNNSQKIKPTWMWYVMYLQAIMGMRISETLDIKWERAIGDNEGESKSFTFLDRNNLHIYAKRKYRAIPIPKRGLEVLKRIPKKIGKGHNPKIIKDSHLENSYSGGYKRQPFKLYKSTYVFENPYTKLPYSTSMLWKSLNEVCDELKFPDYGFHTWRRGFITKMFQIEPNILLIGDYVGHSSKAITDLYKQLHPKHLLSITKSIEKI